MTSSPARNVLIVGASRGLGLEFVRQYRADGARVIATARGDDGLAAIAAQGAKPLRLDVADVASAPGVARRVDGEAFDAIFHVSGVYGPRSTGLEPPSQADIDAAESVAAMRRALAALAPADNGSFLNHDGTPLAW